MFQVLVVEDDQELNRTVCAYLNQNGYQALGCLNANEAYDAMYGGTLFDLIISDIMMPGVDGFAFAKTVRELNQEIPILFMTARDDFASKQRGFQAGIDDYMVKPIDLDELLLRMEALLRRAGRTQQAASTVLQVADLTLDVDSHDVRRGGEEITLTNTEFELLRYLMENVGIVLSKQKILDAVWSYDFGGQVNVVELYISYLRKKIDADRPALIRTVRGAGYIMREPQ